MKPYRLLLVDDDTLSLAATGLVLRENGYEVDTASSGDDAIGLLRQAPDRYALVLLDYRMAGKNGDVTARELLSVTPNTFILIYSGDGSREAMRATWQAGAVGFIEKGSGVDVLLDTVARWCQKYDETLRAINLSAPSENEDWIPALRMIGRSVAMRELATKVTRYRESEGNVLIQGETGTGKELVAAALHKDSRGGFFAVNCAAYKGSTELLEAELFGYEKGSFTGAQGEKKGILESAEGGTVFLDEVHHLSLTAQAKLLRAFQEKKIRRVGGTREMAVSFRLVAAAKPDLEARCESGDFLRDLYHRLNVLAITIRPLRERPEDIEPLVAYFCRRFAETSGMKKTFLVRTLRYLERYAWPGNVRELENTVYRLLTDCDGPKVTPEHLDAKFFKPVPASGSLTYQELKERQEKEEREHVVAVLEASQSKTSAAKRLEVSPSTLHSIMKRIGLYEG